MLNRADCREALDAVLLGKLCGSDQEVVLAGSHGRVVMRKVDNLLRSFKCNVQRSATIGLMLFDLNAFAGHFALEGIDRCLIGTEVEQADLAIGALRRQTTDHRAREVATTVDHYQLHSS